MSVDPSAVHAQSTIAEWVKILITAVVAFTSAVLVDMLKTRINERRKRKGLRKAMYDELAALLGTCDAVLEVKNPNREQSEMLMKVLSAVSTDVYRMAKADPILFYGLKEWQTLDKLYQKIEIFKRSVVLPNAALLVPAQAQEFRNDFVTAIGSKKLSHNVFTPSESESLQINVRAKSAT